MMGSNSVPCLPGARQTESLIFHTPKVALTALFTAYITGYLLCKKDVYQGIRASTLESTAERAPPVGPFYSAR